MTMIIPASAAWRSALYVRGVMCLCGSGVRSVPSRSIARRRYMYYSCIDEPVKTERSIYYPSISGCLRGLQEKSLANTLMLLCSATLLKISCTHILADVPLNHYHLSLRRFV